MEPAAAGAAQHPRRDGVHVAAMTLLRRSLVPLLATTIAALALLAPGALGAQGTPGAALASSATGPTGATGPAGPPQVLSASLSACHTDALAANRYAIFASQMTSVAGTRTMAVNFELQERGSGSASFATVSAPGFGVWVASQPGVGIYTYDHEVTSLPAPAAFRVLVRARWIDRRRHVIRHAQLLSPVCAQPLQTPNLAVRTVKRARGPQAAGEVYSVVVANDGTAPAGAFQVSLSVNGVALPDVTVASLAAGATQSVQFAGPVCTAGSTLTAVADAGATVAEPANPERSRVFPCAR